MSGALPRLLVLLCLLLGSSAGHAHLLNMTKVVVSIDAARQLDVDMQVDMSRAIGSSLAYYRLSQLTQPLRDPLLQTLLDKLVRAVVLQYAGGTVPLRLVEVELPKLPKETFLDPLSWPMTRVRLHGTLPADAPAAQLQGVFTADFRFEEPIALTLQLTTQQRSMTRWLITGQTSPAFALNGGASPVSAESPSLWRYVQFGFTHILPKGLDHVLFVLGLYLGVRQLRSLLWLVTCFTLAHSLTLGLATLHIIRLPAGVVEPLIAASIIWVAVENLRARPETVWRYLLVFGFGLLHGLGFASALAELDLSAGGLVATLLSFNIGIEIGQLSVIALALLVTYRLRQRSWYRRRIVVPASLCIALLAAVWTVQRLGG